METGKQTTNYCSSNFVADKPSEPEQPDSLIAGSGIIAAATSYFYNDWHFALLANFVEADAFGTIKFN